MGYETKIFIVKPYSSFDGWNHQIGEEIASLDLCKLGGGHTWETIAAHMKYDGKPWAIWARTPDRQQEAVTFLRETAKLLPDEDANKLKTLSNDIEDGVLTEDRYGDKLGCVPIQVFVDALKQEIKTCDYRRLKVALALCESCANEFPNENLVVLTYGH